MNTRSRSKPAPAAASAGPVGIIDIGSSAIRLLIAEITRPGEWRVLDQAERPVALGRDVFASGKISRRSISQALQILAGCREVMAGYGVERVRAIGTSALREAFNRDTFLDRVKLRTGLQVEIIDGLETNHLTYLAVLHALHDFRPSLKRTNSLIIEVGGGSTEIMILERGHMAAAHTLRLGTVRVQMQVQDRTGYGQVLESYQRENIRSTLGVLDLETPLQRIRQFVAVGGDARLAAQHAGKPAGNRCAIIQRADFRRFIDVLESKSLDETVNDLHLPYSEAEGLLPALLVYLFFLERTRAEAMVVPQVSIRDGALRALSSGDHVQFQEEFRSQDLASARSLGRKYHFDEAHGDHVRTLALKLFDDLTSEHGLGERQRLLLETAALLHDIGVYVNPSAHHKHGEYLVANAEIFGLRREEIEVVATVIRYHRKAMPKVYHERFTALPPEDRVVVLKLAAILRVADAMDRGHNGHVRDLALEKRDTELVLHAVRHGGSLSLEQTSVTGKADLFEEVFGLKVVLV